MTPEPQQHSAPSRLVQSDRFSYAIPRGLCQCGCGSRTTIAYQNDYRNGILKGEPRWWIKGHHRHVRVPADNYIVADSGCWLWQGALRGPSGYALLTHERKLVYGHRYYYERHVGPIPGGLELDHLCRVKACVNPAHLEAVTHAENVRRAADADRRPECPQGHSFADERNAGRYGNGTRYCKECARVRARAYKQRRQLEAAA